MNDLEEQKKTIFQIIKDWVLTLLLLFVPCGISFFAIKYFLYYFCGAR